MTTSDDLQAKFELLLKENEKLRQENEQLKEEKSNAFHANQKIEHDSDFWKDIRQYVIIHRNVYHKYNKNHNNQTKSKCQTDQDTVKLLIKAKKLTVYDTDSRGETILIMAARYNLYIHKQ